jgi:hypothetical protein
MNIGMLWFDNDPKAGLTTKVERAAVYYLNKYGKSPNLCFVHPTMLRIEPAAAALAESGEAENSRPLESERQKPAERLKNGAIEVRTSRSVLPNHFWIGVNGSVTPTES